MSVDQLPPGKARPVKRDAQFVRYDEYIDKQIDSTRRSVKAVDLLTALLTITVSTLGFLLAAAMIEHWLVPGGFNVAVRLLLFVVLVGFLTLFATRRLWPLVRGSINPAYAAQAIEQENPSLKNSLLNLLLFRQHRDDVTDAVYETLEAEAATRLHRVPIDSAVDRTHLLRLGYALIFILAVVALYKILSPKDPFASAERVLMPWARIAAPSRVSIENIEPGHVTLSRGETLSVAADVRGIGEDDPVVVRFTTADGQAVDRPTAMKPDTAGLRFKGQIPPEGDAALGVAQDLLYYVEAGDARSLEYKVTVISAPTITIERIDYDYPDYTGYVERSIERLGDIRAIEGTRVTIHAQANQSIDEAAIDFESDGRRDVQFTAQGEQAQASFTLELRDDRQTAKYTSYSLRFTGVDGRSNRDPVKFPIEVVPDVQPEAAILAPKEKTRDVRLDETVEISVEARDPDFALSEVRVEGESAGRNVIDGRLLGGEHNGRFTGRLLFTPAEHELHAGDAVRYWVTARDNRAPSASETTTDSQTFRIVGPDPRKPPQDRIAQRGQPGQRDQPQDNPQQQGAEQHGQQQNEGQGGQSGGQSSDSSEGGEQGENQQSGESSSAEGESGESGGQGSANQSSEDGSGESSQNQQQGEQPSGGESSGGGESSASELGGELGQAQQRPGGKQQSGEGGQPGQQSNSRQGLQEGSPEGPQAVSQGSRDRGEGTQNNAQREGEDAPAREARDQQGDSSPVSSEGDNDGEAFERIQEFLKKEGQLPKEPAEQNANEHASAEKGVKQQAGESSSADSESGKQEWAEQPTGEQQSGERQGASGEQRGDETQPNDSSMQESESRSGDSPAPSQSEQPGADTKSGNNQSQTDEPSSNADKQQPDGGQQTNSQGESGAGDQPEQGQGAPESQDLKPTEKWQQRPSGDEPGEQQEAPSGGHGKRESDSQGDQGGDHAGGGEEGGGQKSNRDGTGSSGQNQSADEGAGESSEQGAGRNSSSGGQDAQPNERTGESSQSMQGEGSQQLEGEGSKAGGERGNQQGQSQGGERGEKQEGSPGAEGQQQGQQGQSGEQGQQQQPSQSGGEQGANNSQNGGEDAPARAAQNQESNEAQGAQRSGNNAADGAGRVPDAPIRPGSATGEAPGADAANLEYARRETDLVLETLAEQMKRQKVDKRLLDKLGWTEADMKRFVERWQQLKAAADANGPDANEAQRELDDALRSLGLRRGELRQLQATDDQNRNLRQGYRGPVPLEYQERLRAYNQGVSRARQEDD